MVASGLAFWMMPPEARSASQPSLSALSHDLPARRASASFGRTRGRPRGERGELGHEAAVGVEELVGPVAAQPFLQHGQVRGIGADVRDGHLVRPERPLHRQAVHGQVHAAGHGSGADGRRL